MADNATLYDFLGEGVNDLPDAPAETEASVRKRRALAAQRERDALLADIPYGSPESPTAGAYQATTQPAGGRFKSDSTVVQRVNADGSRTVVADYSGANPYDPQKPGQSVGVTASNPGDPRNATTRLLDTDGNPAPGGPGAVPVDTESIADDAARRADEGKADRGNALQSLIDRFESAGTLDISQQQQSRAAQQAAIQQNRELYSRATSYDPAAAAAKFSEESLSKALAIARSAPGGASRESALYNALESLPALQAEGQRQANAEGRDQQQVALQASSQLGQIATGTRSQDEQQAEAYTGIGLDVAKSIANVTGSTLQLDQRDREFLGEVALSIANLNLDVERLGIDEALRRAELELQRQGLGQEWRQFKESQKITGKDILGGIFGLGGAVVSGGATVLGALAGKK